MKVLSVVGSRPQFPKAAALHRALVARGHTHVLVHTGQHYDPLLSDAFFADLSLPPPDYHLGVGSGSHGQQTGLTLQRVEPVLERERPDWTLVYGDTNATPAGALAAVKLHLPCAHVEAGLRSFDRNMPEEINRIVADHVCDVLFAPTEHAVENLRREGLGVEGRSWARVELTGDVMYDSLLYHLPVAESRSSIMRALRLKPGDYVVATVHRAANTDDPARLERILMALAALREPVIVPAHPRMRLAMASSDIEAEPPVRVIEPLGYLDMLQLIRHARMVATDSGGVQREAFWLRVPCVTLREETEWPETLADGWNVLAGADPDAIVAACRRPRPSSDPPPAFGDGHAADKMVELLERDSSHR